MDSEQQPDHTFEPLTNDEGTPIALAVEFANDGTFVVNTYGTPEIEVETARNHIVVMAVAYLMAALDFPDVPDGPLVGPIQQGRTLLDDLRNRAPQGPRAEA